MARMLRALQHAPRKTACTPAVAVEEIPAGPAEMSFIEVGAGTMSASADVLNAPPVRGKIAPEAKPASDVRLALHQPSETPSIQFRPFSAAPPASRGLARELIAYLEPDHPLSEQYRLIAGKLTENDTSKALLMIA